MNKKIKKRNEIKTNDKVLIPIQVIYTGMAWHHHNRAAAYSSIIKTMKFILFKKMQIKQNEDTTKSLSLCYNIKIFSIIIFSTKYANRPRHSIKANDSFESRKFRTKSNL